MTQHRSYLVMGAALSATDQVAAASSQVAAALRSQPLTSVGAELHPSDFLVRPTNMIGAYARVAYWLAVAARPASAGARVNGVLVQAASSALAQAQAKNTFTLLDASAINLLGTTTLPAQVDKALYDAEQVARGQGRRDIAAVFNQLRAQAVTTSTSGGSVRAGMVAVGSWATIIVSVGILGAGLVYFGGPIRAAFKGRK